MYNSEMWTLTQRKENRHLPEKPPHERPQMATKNHKCGSYDQNETNKLVRYHQKKRLSWYGHVSRLDAQTALKHIRSNNNMKKHKETQGWTEKNMDNIFGERPR